MNFTQEIKRELMKKLPQEESDRRAFLGAVLDVCGERKEGGFSFTIESEEIAACVLLLAEQSLGVQMTLTAAERDPKQGRDKLTFSCAGEIGSYSGGGSAQSAAYIRGAFLCGGSCTLPRAGKKTGYHLEVAFGSDERAENFCGLLSSFQLIGSVIPRGDRRVVYIKSREGISDFLSVAGAENALATLEEVTAEREERNEENRRENCYAGNADRTAIANAAQVRALNSLCRSGRMELLGEPLKEAAQARLDHPELSLGELAEFLGLSKSCLNHRLRKLMELSRTL